MLLFLKVLSVSLHKLGEKRGFKFECIRCYHLHNYKTIYLPIYLPIYITYITFMTKQILFFSQKVTSNIIAFRQVINSRKQRENILWSIFVGITLRKNKITESILWLMFFQCTSCRKLILYILNLMHLELIFIYHVK